MSSDENLSLNKYGIGLTGGTQEHPPLLVDRLEETGVAIDYLEMKDRIVGINGVLMRGYTWDEAMYLLQKFDSEIELTIERKVTLKPSDFRPRKPRHKPKLLDHGDSSSSSGNNSGDNSGTSVPIVHYHKPVHSGDSGTPDLKSLSVSEKQQIPPKIKTQILPEKVEKPPAVEIVEPPAPIPEEVKKPAPKYKIFGVQEKCTKCHKTVYHAERCIGPKANIYHKMCLSCVICRSNLSTGNWCDHDSLPYCRSCYQKNFGLHGSKR